MRPEGEKARLVTFWNVFCSLNSATGESALISYSLTDEFSWPAATVSSVPGKNLTHETAVSLPSKDFTHCTFYLISHTLTAVSTEPLTMMLRFTEQMSTEFTSPPWSE